MTLVKFDEFKRAYNDYPSQDNEGFVPDRAGFKCGFNAAWDIQQIEINRLKEKLALAVEALSLIEARAGHDVVGYVNGKVVSIAQEALTKIRGTHERS